MADLADCGPFRMTPYAPRARMRLLRRPAVGPDPGLGYHRRRQAAWYQLWLCAGIRTAKRQDPARFRDPAAFYTLAP